MANLSKYLQEKWMNWLFKNTSAGTAPANLYIALLITAPTDDSGTGAVEVTGGSYVRLAVAAGSAWSAFTGGTTTPSSTDNAADLTFVEPTAAWGTVTALAVYDASSAGNLMFWQDCSPTAVNLGAAPTIDAGQLIFTLD